MQLGVATVICEYIVDAVSFWGGHNEFLMSGHVAGTMSLFRALGDLGTREG